MAVSTRKTFLVRHFKRWWDRQIMPRLDWIQIEVTTRCNAFCNYCPRTAYRTRWENRDLSRETFQTLLPVIANSKMLHLQGWGEPLLHPDFFKMIASAKKTGSKVGTTTNGMLLDRPGIDRLIKSGIDYIAFSLAGVGEKNDLVRSGTRFTQILQAISDLAARKKALRAETPAISIAYLLLRSHLPDLPGIVPALAGFGIQQVVISTLDFVADENLGKERLVPENDREYRELKSLLDHLVRDAERKGIDISYHLVSPGAKPRGCTENPRRAVFVSADGNVSPCVFTNIPAPGASHIVDGREREYRRLTFGNIADDELPSIWKRPDYRMFRKDCESQPHPFCQGCPKRREGSE